MEEINEANAFQFRQFKAVGFLTWWPDAVVGKPLVQVGVLHNAVAVEIDHSPQAWKPSVVHIGSGESHVAQGHCFETPVISGAARQFANAGVASGTIVHLEAIDKGLCRKEIQSAVALIAARIPPKEDVFPKQLTRCEVGKIVGQTFIVAALV